MSGTIITYCEVTGKMILYPNNQFPLQSITLMDNFMKLAQSNTDKNLETYGVLAGSLVSVVFKTTLVSLKKC